MSSHKLAAHKLAGRLGAAFGSLYYELAASRRHVARRNLALAFPEATERELERLARASLRHFGRAVFESLSLDRMTAERICGLLSFEGWHHFAESAAEDGGAIVLTAHLGVHEVVGPVVALYRGPMHVVARRFRNPSIERRVRRARERFGNRTLPKEHAARGMLRALANHETVAILIDQRVHPYRGIRVPFFGRDSWTSPLPAHVSLRTGAPVLPLFAYSRPGGRYLMVAHPPIVPHARAGSKPADTDLHELTAKYSQVTESAIRREPEQWLWGHDRWRRH